MAATPNLLYDYNFIKGNSNGNSVDDIPATGGTPAVEGDDAHDNISSLWGLAIDASAGVYFVSGETNNDDFIYEEHFGQTFSTTPLNGATPLGTVLTPIRTLALNAGDDLLYYTSGTGFYEEKFSGANYTGSATVTQLATLPTSAGTTDDQLAFDQADHTAYFASPKFFRNSTSGPLRSHAVTAQYTVTSNYLYVVSGVTSSASGNLSTTALNLGGLGGQLTDAQGRFFDGVISGVALDSATDTLYIITKPGGTATSNFEGLFAYKLNAGGTTGTLSTIWKTADPSNNNPLDDMSYITVDPTTGDYYVSNANTNHPGIYEGNVGDTGNKQPTALLSLPGPTGGVSSGDITTALAIDPAPTVASDAVTAIDGATSHTTGVVTTADTVTFTVTFSQKIFVTGNPTLTLNDGGAASFVSSSSGSNALTFTYKPANGQNIPALAVTGVGGGGVFADSAGTPADLSNIAQTFASLRVQTTAPVVNASASVQYSEIGSPVALDPGLTVSDPDGSGQLQSATVQITGGFLGGDVLSASLAGTPNITANYDGAGTLTLSGADTLADYQTALDSVTYSSTAPDATNGGADASRTITWSVNDGVFSNTTPETSAVTIVPCFCRGARILTERGEVAVERLKVGDLAVTASGRLRPVVWISRRGLDLTRHTDAAAVRPIRVRAGAFGEGLPHRDLWLSPGHNVAIDGVLIAASLLVNDRSVAQMVQDNVEYWHVELDAHDILLAEGLPTESYLDTGNRTAFADGGAFAQAHPDFKPRHWAATCLPLAFDGPAVTAAKVRLLARLAAEGERLGRGADPNVLVDSIRVEPIPLTPTRLAFVLPRGAGKSVLRSNVFVPAHAVAENRDARELGLCIARLEIDGETIDIETDEGGLPGWRDPEYANGRFSHRWTTGVTPLPFGARLAIVDLAGEGYFWREREENVGAMSA